MDKYSTLCEAYGRKDGDCDKCPLCKNSPEKEEDSKETTNFFKGMTTSEIIAAGVLHAERCVRDYNRDIAYLEKQLEKDKERLAMWETILQQWKERAKDKGVDPYTT